MAKMFDHEVIIVGAGVQGLIAAKTFLQCQPSLNLRILESAPSIGGVWKKESLYPGLRTNNLRGTFEFNDYPLPDDLGVKFGEHIPGTAVNEYICRYAEKHNLYKQCSVNTKVESCERVDGGWKLRCSSSSNPVERLEFTCQKLVVATGLTSTPVPLEVKGSEAFSGPLVNFASLAAECEKLLAPSIEHVAVFGGGKASYDAVHLLASHGKRVSWIIRGSGHGPTWMAKPHAWIGPVKVWLEPVVSARLTTFMSPCLWGPADGFGRIRSFFHNTRVGRWISKSFYAKLSHETLAQSGLLGDEKLKSLIPEENATWYGAGFSVLNYPTDFHDYVRNGQVQILRKDIETLGASNTIHFTDKYPSIQVDALVCSMGWSYALPFDMEPRDAHASLGIPSMNYTTSQAAAWSSYESAADSEILSRFPSLAHAPRPEHKSLPAKAELPTDVVPTEVKQIERMTPWRLWRGIAPPALAAAPEHQRSIVFLGMLFMLQTVPRAELQALWAWSWMYGHMSPRLSFRLTSQREAPQLQRAAASLVDTNDTSDAKARGLQVDQEYNDVFYDTALFNRTSRWRAPYGYGHSFPDFVFDGLPYFDLLLRDLGLKFWRKGTTALGEIFSKGYLPRDYRGIVEEWKASQKSFIP